MHMVILIGMILYLMMQMILILIVIMVITPKYVQDGNILEIGEIVQVLYQVLSLQVLFVMMVMIMIVMVMEIVLIRNVDHV